MSLALGPELLIHSSFDDTAVRRAHARGALVRLAAGRHARRDVWSSLGPGDQHVLRALAAVSCLRNPAVVSHDSAAAFWKLPRLGEWPSRPHVIDTTLSRSTSVSCAFKHSGALPAEDIEVRCGVEVTSVVRTALDIATSAPLRQAVVALDHALHEGMTTTPDLLEALGRRTSPRGAVKARRAVTFADARADSPGESLSRVILLEAGLPIPELQHRFTNPTGRDAVVDFWWREQGVVGEFDGEVKYRDARLRAGLSAEEVVIREKDRENWIRSQSGVRTVVRWTWRDLMSTGRLPRLLSAAGVAPRSRGVLGN